MKRFIYAALAFFSIITFAGPAEAEAKLKADFAAAINSTTFLPNAGDSIAWADGTLHRNSKRQLVYTYNNGQWILNYFIGQEFELMGATGYGLKRAWANEYGVDVSRVAGNQTASRIAWSRAIQKGTPNTSYPVGGNGGVTILVNYDAWGNAATVSYDGKTTDPISFQRTNWFKSLTGIWTY